jgi:hypothetical protein
MQARRGFHTRRISEPACVGLQHETDDDEDLLRCHALKEPATPRATCRTARVRGVALDNVNWNEPTGGAVGQRAQIRRRSLYQDQARLGPSTFGRSSRRQERDQVAYGDSVRCPVLTPKLQLQLVWQRRLQMESDERAQTDRYKKLFPTQSMAAKLRVFVNPNELPHSLAAIG